MKFAFCLYKYFPYGGLQRDFMRIARECQHRGHEVKVYVLTWHGPIPEDIDVTIVPVKAMFNHHKYRMFSEWMETELLRSPVDCVVGFNKMPNLDIYYAADSCYEEKARTQRGRHYKLLPRYKHFAGFERAVFGADSKTQIMSISEVQEPFFIKHYGTQRSRLHVLPPGISRDRIAPGNAESIRRRKRDELGLTDNDRLLLFVGSGFIKKGLKRAIMAVDALPEEMKHRTKFLIIGEDKPHQFQRLINRLHLQDTIEILGGSDEIPDFLVAGDLLIHPAWDENAGMVLLEAMVAGLPVLATDVCGYAHYVEEADMGRLVPSPFQQEDLNQLLLEMLREENRARYVENGKRFAHEADIYSLPQKAADVIEQVMADRANFPSQLPESKAPPRTIDISAIIIAKNEEGVIARCLSTLAFCDDILLVDSGSTDRTIDIARRYGARIQMETDWQGPATQRNRGIAGARHNWCLLLDADEWVTDEYRDEILALDLGHRQEAAFRTPRLSSYCGQFMHHSGWRPDYVVRLIHRDRARYEGGIVHDHCVVDGSLGTLNQSLMHEPYRSLDQVLDKVNSYSTWGSQDLVRGGGKGSLTRAILHGLWAFVRTYTLRGGFMDGRHGFMLAISNAETTYYKYVKAMLLAEQASRGTRPS